MAGLSVEVPPLRLRVRGPTVTLTSGGPPSAVVKLDLRCRDCDRRLDEPFAPAACAMGATAARAAILTRQYHAIRSRQGQGDAPSTTFASASRWKLSMSAV